MALFVNSALAAGTAVALARANGALTSATQRLASGLRINSARDDAAGLAMATRMTAQISGLGAARRNSLDAVSLAQTAEGGLASIGANLQRLRELAVQAANATQSASDRAALQLEASALVDEVDRVSRSTRFNGMALLDGTFVAPQFQVGANVGQTIALAGTTSVRASALGVVQMPPPTTATLQGTQLSAASAITGAGQLVINGVDLWTGSTIVADARNLAAAINAAGIGGLSATPEANVMVGTWSAGPPDGYGVIDDYTGIGYSFGTLSQTQILDIMTYYFNTAGIAPGVTATERSDGLTLTRADGGNFALNFSSGSPEILGLGGLVYGLGVDGVNYGRFDLHYATASSLTIGGSKAAAIGFTPGTIAALPPPSGSTLDRLDLSTVAGANDALITLDASIDTVDAQRALFGAAQSRFVAAIGASEDAAATTGAARSRIVDADYAGEAALLLRAQILQQAGTAMVAQANARRSDVLQLLRA